MRQIKENLWDFYEIVMVTWLYEKAVYLAVQFFNNIKSVKF